MAEYSIERISSGNIQHLQTLYRAVFRKKVSMEFLSKKYDTTFSGAQFIGYLAFAPNHSPAAFYGVLPCFFRLGGQTIRAAQSADTMTHPRHRRAGLFLRLAQETYVLARQNGIELIFGFPNQHSLPGFVKLKWTFLPAPMKFFRLPVNAHRLSKIAGRIPITRKILKKRIRQKFSTEGKHVNAFGGLKDGIIKDQAFLAYKTYSDSFFIDVDGVPAWIKFNGTLKIGYADLHPDMHIEPFLEKLQEIASLAGCRELIFITAENSSVFRSLSTVAGSVDSFPVGLYALTQRNWDFSNLQFEYCDIDIF